MFGTSDVIEGVGDLTSGITCQGLDQRSYNPIKDEVFGGNELACGAVELAVSLGTSAAVSKALAGTAVKEAEIVSSNARVVGESGAVARGAEEFVVARCIGAKPYLEARNPSVDFAGKSGVGRNIKVSFKIK